MENIEGLDAVQSVDSAINLTFLGVGGASQESLGHASAVVELGDQRMLIDCGPGTLKLFCERYEALPDAVFITHCHLDHIGDFENLFIKCWFDQPSRWEPTLFVPVSIIPLLHERVASYPAVLAEGGVNFWDAFKLIPVKDHFIFSDSKFGVIPVRHHAPNTAFGLLLEKRFFYTGDTRPIPEVLKYQVNQNELIFHDCGVVGNPSHTGVDDLMREYDRELLSRIFCYHYYTQDDISHFQQHDLHVVTQGETFKL